MHILQDGWGCSDHTGEQVLRRHALGSLKAVSFTVQLAIAVEPSGEEVMPHGQLVHMDDGAVQYLPDGQARQSASVWDPTAENLPGSHICQRAEHKG